MEQVIEIELSEAPFLVGVKGRNIALIRKCSGMLISISGTSVVLKRQRPSSKPDLAVRMILSACHGGILRWFVTAAATHEGHPFDRIHELELLAQSSEASESAMRAHVLNAGATRRPFATRKSGSWSFGSACGSCTHRRHGYTFSS